MKLGKLMKSQEILAVCHSPNINVMKKDEKQSPFPLPSFATLWVNK